MRRATPLREGPGYDQLGGHPSRVIRKENLTRAGFCLANGKGAEGREQSELGERPWSFGLKELGTQPEGQERQQHPS